MSSSENQPTGRDDVSRFEGEDHHGWAPDMDEPTGAAEEAKAKAFDASQAGEPGPGRIVSEEERAGVPATDMSGATPLGVGESTGRRGEEIAATEEQPGREHTGHKGPAQRPTGTTTAEGYTGVGQQGTRDEDAPEMPFGDQGG
ncbi:MAG: hypothetical protein JOZ47_07030 [Kutzneria sp.]|nr:hypothetical protein [Kutzneria sp.]